ncbi:MAG: HD domain-containing phosphohydrolase [Dehalococcoidia bacterium]
MSSDAVRDAIERQALVYAEELRQVYEAERERRRELEEANAALRRLAETRATFIALLSHELRTPITIIDAYLALLRKERVARSPQEQVEMIEALARRTEELKATIIELTAFAELSTSEASEVPLAHEFEAAEIVELASKTSRVLQPLAEASRVRLEQRIDPAVDRFHDLPRLRLIVEHLWSNAVKFGKAGGFARLVISEEGDDLVIAVEDDGIGIATEQREAIFEPFQQLEPVMRRRSRGLGLGLAIVRLAVRDLEGTLTLDSQPSAGSVFTVRLPLLTGSAALQQELEDLRLQVRALEQQAVVAIDEVRSLDVQQRGHREEVLRRDHQLVQLAQNLKVAYELERNAHAAMQRTYTQTVRALSMAVEARDDLTGDHIGRVAALSRVVGQQLGLEGATLELLEMVAVLHDVGKIGVPDSILNKPGSLTAEEWQVMQSHPTVGGELTRPIEFLALASPCIAAHHERYDGSGYPNGLAGNEIPLESRIVSIVDSFDAMTHDRPYRKAMPVAEALAELQRCAGSQFDPGIAATFCRAWNEGFIHAPDVQQTRFRRAERR